MANAVKVPSRAARAHFIEPTWRAFLGCIVMRPEDGTPHPGLHFDVLQPIFRRWDPAEVVFNVLLTDRAYRNSLPVAVRDCRPEYCLAQENAFAVMAMLDFPLAVNWAAANPCPLSNPTVADSHHLRGLHLYPYLELGDG